MTNIVRVYGKRTKEIIVFLCVFAALAATGCAVVIHIFGFRFWMLLFGAAAVAALTVVIVVVVTTSETR